MPLTISRLATECTSRAYIDSELQSDEGYPELGVMADIEAHGIGSPRPSSATFGHGHCDRYTLNGCFCSVVLFESSD
ncbi:unnamed protein product [Arctia plantaginis]|uniref:Uncharacterized protein n=1 Tax=Arctia plantaginis TaxID=874455 RepID=A0A8S0ZG20_ARCPL|nr:unnamed protein product [Arctia plantaginis]